jgi:uncharacterized glyoxalase superfamily protein PhnB
MKLFRVIIPVSNIEDAATFYQCILRIEGARVSNGRHYFNCGGTILACFDPMADGDQVRAEPNPEHIYLSVANLREVYERMNSEYMDCITDGIETRPWGETSFYAHDPFGNPLCFVDETSVFVG